MVEYVPYDYDGSLAKDQEDRIKKFVPTSFTEHMKAVGQLSFPYRVTQWALADSWKSDPTYDVNLEPEMQKGGFLYGNPRFMGIDNPNEFRYAKEAFFREAKAHQLILKEVLLALVYR